MLAHAQSRIQKPESKLILFFICLLAFALRLGPLWDNRFHPDEALFSTWALRIARGENILLTGVPVDKPPLLIYLTAISYFIFGQSELAARVPNLLASVISVPLLYQLAQRYRRAELTALIAALLLALSPFAILFAPTAFLDPMMVMFGLAALVAASRGRAGWAGILLGLSFATKVQGLLFAPLIPVFWLSRQVAVRGPARDLFPKGRCTDILSRRHPFWSLLLCLVLTVIVVILWDRARGGLPFWVQQTINYGGIRVIYTSELDPRLGGWLSLLPYFFGPIVGLIGLIGLPFLLYVDLTRGARTRSAFMDLALITYVFGFFTLHWLLAFPVWDRYFLILVPMAALLCGRVIGNLIPSERHRISVSSGQRVSQSLLLALLAITVLPFSLAAAESQYPIGGDHGAEDGIDQVAEYLKGLPSGTVVYDHWLAWELGYYMGDGFAYLAYFDTPAALADDLRVFARGDDRYVLFPARESPAKVIDAIGQVGYTLMPVLTTMNRFGQTSFTVFKIVKR